MSARPARLCIFTRVPVPGRVKQRLAARLGDAAALRAHEHLVEDTLVRLGRVPDAVTELWIDGAPNPAIRRWARDWNLEVRRQRGEDLGERMADALLRALAVCPAALVVGTDCPDIDAGYAQSALRLLEHCEVVIGPAEDGGYGLIGARQSAAARVPELFRGIRWGSGSVLDATLARAAAAGLSLARLPAIWDVDTEADWQRYLRARQPREAARPESW